jgi:hypothetical protein
MDLSDIDKFRDPIWRISNLYSIRTRDGKVIPFRPRPQQAQVLEMIFKKGLKHIVVLKARQLGFSTLLGVICTDQLCWTTGKQLSLIDRTQENARQKLRDIVALAYDSVHDELKARFIVDRSNAGELGVRFHEYKAAQTSTLFAGTHARGGANSFLWISEWGFVQCEDLRRSEEILTGAIPSAKDGTIVVETTWRGGRGGHLWDIVKKALETPEEQKRARRLESGLLPLVLFLANGWPPLLDPPRAVTGSAPFATRRESNTAAQRGRLKRNELSPSHSASPSARAARSESGKSSVNSTASTTGKTSRLLASPITRPNGSPQSGRKSPAAPSAGMRKRSQNGSLTSDRRPTVAWMR